MVQRSVLVNNILSLINKHGSRKVSGVVAEFLLRNGRTKELPSILRDISLARQQQNIIEVTAVSASELSGKQESEVQKRVSQLYPKGQKIIVNNRVDKSVIGGIRLEFPDKQLDMSVESRITNLRESIKERNNK